MLKAFLVLIAATLFSTAHSFGQTKSTQAKEKNHAIGFYGKRFVLQLGAGAHHNTMLKITSEREKALRNTAYYSNYRSEIGTDQFNYSVYGTMGVVLKERFSFAVDVNYYFGNIFLKSVGRKQYTDYLGNFIYEPGYDARVKYNTLRIMPRIEIGSRNSNMPVGLVNVLGIGAELSKLKSDTYTSISGLEDSYMDSVVIADRPLKFNDESTFNLTLLYGLEYRLPISKNIAWNFGGYVHLNIPVQELLSESGFFENIGYDDEYKSQLSRYRAQNLFSVRTGIVIML